MLVDVDLKSSALADLEAAERLDPGVFLIPHFNGGLHLGDGVKRPVVDGVCDSFENFMEQVGDSYDVRQERYVAFLTCVRRADQPPTWGWRWSRWGPYCGTQRKVSEFLYDEPDIERVYVFTVYDAP